MVLDELELPDEGQDWQTQLRRSAHSFRRLGLHRLHPRQFPILRSLASNLAHYDGSPSSTHVLDLLLLAGITATRG